MKWDQGSPMSILSSVLLSVLSSISAPGKTLMMKVFDNTMDLPTLATMQNESEGFLGGFVVNLCNSTHEEKTH